MKAEQEKETKRKQVREDDGEREMTRKREIAREMWGEKTENV